MLKELGHIRELVTYPVKSMAGAATDSAFLGSHGLEGDRRFAFRRVGDESGFPWLTASRVPQLLLYVPAGFDGSSGELAPTHVRTPAGKEVELRSEELQREIADIFGGEVELMKLENGIFDEAAVSVISLTTIDGIGAEVGAALDRRRFRANIVLETRAREPFVEDGWVGGTLLFGDGEVRPAVRVTARDVRCVVINLDPDTAIQDKRIIQSVVRLNENNAGVYGTVVRTGTIRVGDPVRLALDERC